MIDDTPTHEEIAQLTDASARLQRRIARDSELLDIINLARRMKSTDARVAVWDSAVALARTINGDES